MSRSSGLRSKLVYLAIIIVMLIPLYLLGQPSSGREGDTGGQLTRMRSDFNMSEADLGEIDAASESMKLATLGMRGIAASLLWKKSHDYKVHHEWDRLRATLDQIAKLQPHYENVWEHQAHNLSYNVSAQFDDYRQRYSWVKKGMGFLAEGVRRNRTAPRLVWYTGWFYGQKLGMADEKVQFREMFRQDAPFHEEIQGEGIEVDSPDARGPEGLPDNWLVGRLWLHRGYRLVDEEGVELRGKTPLIYYEAGPKWRIAHATAIETEGVLDDRAKDAWERAADDWYAFGMRLIPASDGFTIRLGATSDLVHRRAELEDQFDALIGDTREQLREARYQQLSPEERAAVDKPEAERNQEEYFAARQAEARLTPPPDVVARAAPSEVQLKAMQLAREINDLTRRLDRTRGYREQTNYDYWETRCRAEQEDLMLEARRLVYEAERLNEEAELDAAIDRYEQAWSKWAEVFDRYPVLVIDAASDDLMDSINRYRVAIDRGDLPEDFALANFVELRELAENDPEEFHRRQMAAENPEMDERRDAQEESQRAELPSVLAPQEPGDALDAEPLEAPEAEEPVTEAPAAESPVTEEAEAEEPAAEEPVTDGPGREDEGEAAADAEEPSAVTEP